MGPGKEDTRPSCSTMAITHTNILRGRIFSSEWIAYVVQFYGVHLCYSFVLVPRWDVEVGLVTDDLLEVSYSI